MVDIGGYTGKKIEVGACPICGEMGDMCAANDPDVKMLPPTWAVEKAKREYFKDKLGLGDKSKLKQLNL